MPSPVISVLIPCYNQARFLAQTLESVLAQKNVSLEVIVSDDASTDETADIATRFAKTDQRVHVQRHHKNLGMAANWNWCLAQARGEFVKYVFGDDYLTAPDSLQQLLAPILDHPHVALSTSARLIVDENSETKSIANLLGPDGVLPGRDAIVRCLLANKNLIGEPSAVLFRRTLSARGFEPSYRQSIDLEFWAHLLEQGDLAYVSRPLCAFRRHNEQQTAINSRTRAAEQEGLRLYAKYLPVLQQHIAAGGSRHAVRRAVFRTLYFARKTHNRPPEAQASEKTLLAYLSPLGYLGHWLLHRLTKPISNLQRSIIPSETKRP